MVDEENTPEEEYFNVEDRMEEIYKKGVNDTIRETEKPEKKTNFKAYTPISVKNTEETEEKELPVQYRFDEEWFETLDVAYNIKKAKSFQRGNTEYSKSDFIRDILVYWDKIPRTVNINSVKLFRRSSKSYRQILDLDKEFDVLDFCGIKTKQYNFYADKDLNIMLMNIERRRYLKIPQCMRLIIPCILMIFADDDFKKMRSLLTGYNKKINLYSEHINEVINDFCLEVMNDYGKGYVDIRDFNNGFDFLYDFINTQKDNEEISIKVKDFLEITVQHDRFMNIIKESPDIDLKKLFMLCTEFNIELPTKVAAYKGLLNIE